MYSPIMYSPIMYSPIDSIGPLKLANSSHELKVCSISGTEAVSAE